MKRKKRIKWFWGAGLLAIAAALVLAFAVGRRPFRALKAEEIAAATVWLGPPDVTIELNREQIEELVLLLRQVRVTRRDDSYAEADGQGVLYTLTMRDGRVCRAMAYAPFFVIDGRGYQTAYRPCNALNQFGNQILWETANNTK